MLHTVLGCSQFSIDNCSTFVLYLVVLNKRGVFMVNVPQRAKAIWLKKAGLTYAQIGKDLGVTRQRAQQLVRPSPMVYAVVLKRADGMCQSCFKLLAGCGHVHHRSPDVEIYNSLDNLLLVCLSCHRALHPEKKEQCPKGHMYNEENTIVKENSKGKTIRTCKACYGPKGRRTHCKHGHEFTKENTYQATDKQGRKSNRCKTCCLEGMRKYKERKKIELLTTNCS